MQVLVVGAGVTGLMTAYALFSRGIHVTILEGRSSPCQGASYSCSGLIGEATPLLLSSPETSLLGSQSQVVYGPGLLFQHPIFARLMKKSRAADRFAELTALAQTFSQTSIEWFRQHAKTEGFQLQESAGTLIAQSPKAKKAEGAEEIPLSSWLQIEPSLYALAPETALQMSRSVSWSISYFAKQLKEWLIEHDVPIKNNQTVTGFVMEAGRCTGVKTASDTLSADAVIVAAGLGALPLLKAAKVKLPVLPLTRCVLNTTLFSDATRIRHSVIDPEGFLLSPLEDFLRVQGRWYIGEEGDFDRNAEYRALWEVGMKYFPDIGDWKNARYFSQTILTTPDTLGVVGESGVPGLWLNVAGGIHGGDFAPYYAETLAALLAGETPEHAAVLSAKRFQ